MDREEQGKKMGQVIAKAWEDEEFKQRLLKDATAVLKDEGMDVPQDLEVRALENTDNVFHLIIPEKPSNFPLFDDALDSVVGGGDWKKNFNFEKYSWMKDMTCGLNRLLGLSHKTIM